MKPCQRNRTEAEKECNAVSSNIEAPKTQNPKIPRPGRVLKLAHLGMSSLGFRGLGFRLMG